MTELQKRFFLFSLAAFIGTTAFNGTQFVFNNADGIASVINHDRTFISRTYQPAPPLESIVQTRKSPAPTNLTAELTVEEDGSDSITLMWEGKEDSKGGYSIYKKTATDSTYAFLLDIPGDITTFVDVIIDPDTTYTYKVKSLTSDFSNESNPTRIPPQQTTVDTVFGEIEL